MTKTKDAFALRDFNGERILQRPYFKEWREKYHVDESKSDAEILAMLAVADSDELSTLQSKAGGLSELYDCVKNYQQKRLARHVKKLNEYARAVADKIATDETADIELLRTRHKRAGELAEKYTIAINGDEISTLQAIAAGVVDACGLSAPIAATYKSVTNAIKNFYRQRFARRLKKARQDNQLTQQELADKLKISRRALAGYELAEREPPISVVVQMSQVCNVTTDWLFGIVPE